MNVSYSVFARGVILVSSTDLHQRDVIPRYRPLGYNRVFTLNENPRRHDYNSVRENATRHRTMRIPSRRTSDIVGADISPSLWIPRQLADRDITPWPKLVMGTWSDAT